MIVAAFKSILAHCEIEKKPVLVYEKDKYFLEMTNRFIRITLNEGVEIKSVKLNFFGIKRKDEDYILNKNVQSIINLDHLVTKEKALTKELEIRLGKNGFEKSKELWGVWLLHFHKTSKDILKVFENNEKEVFIAFLRLNSENMIENVSDSNLKNILKTNFDDSFYESSLEDDMLSAHLKNKMEEVIKTYTLEVTPRIFYNDLILEISNNILENLKKFSECEIKYTIYGNDEKGENKNTTHVIQKSTDFLYDEIMNCITEEDFINSLLRVNNHEVNSYISGLIGIINRKIRKNIDKWISEDTLKTQFKFLNFRLKAEDNLQMNISDMIERISSISVVVKKYFLEYEKMSFTSSNKFQNLKGLNDISIVNVVYC